MKHFQLALQLFSVRDDVAADFAGTLRRVRSFGYDGVEFAGLYGHSAADVRQMCGETGLVPISAHVAYAEMLEHPEVFAAYRDSGCRFIVSPWLDRELLLPAPWVVVRRLCELAATAAFWRITAVSIGRVLLGITAAVALGTGMAVACAASKTADALLRPLMTVVKSTPVASFVVLALVWIARDWLPVFISLLMVLPVVWSNVCTGIRSADPALLELAQVYGWPRGRILRRIYLPGVRPHFLSALRSGIGFGWKSAIAAEVLTVPHSAIGRMIYESKLYLQTTDLFAWTLAVILLSVGLEWLVLRALTPRGKGGGGT